MPNDRSTGGNEPWEEWIEYQQNEIDGAKDDIGERLKHITGAVSHGILNGEFITQHQNDRAEAYLEGYADALEYAATRVKRIDNLVKYAESAVENADAENTGNEQSRGGE